MIRRLLTLTLIIGLTLITLPQQEAKAKAKTESTFTVKQAIVKHSIELGIDPALGLSIAKQESGFCHDKRSSYGAVGVFQLMPQTARRMGYNPYDRNENIKGGLTYYKTMYKMFGSVELALAAYNAGPGNVKKYKGMPPFSETKRFVSNIMSEYNYQKTYPDASIRQYNHSTKPAQKPQPPKAPLNQAADKDILLNNFMLTQAI